MTTLQKLAAGAVLAGVITAATLPGRQTVPVIGAIQKLFSGAGHTVITGGA